MNDIQLNSYRIFYEAAKEKSISRAAEKIYISQPAITKSVKNLESSLGVTLFRRGHRGVSLTEEGEILFSHLDKAFSEINTAENILSEIRGGGGRLTIGTSAVLCKNMLLPFLKGFSEKNPSVKINIDCASSRASAENLEKGSIDAALIVRPSKKYDFDFFSLGEISDIFAASPKFLRSKSFTDNGKKLSSDEFGKLIEQAGGIMLLDKTNGTRRHIDRFFDEHGIAAERYGIIEVSGMDMLIEFALTGLGIACVIRSFVNEYLENGLLEEIKLKENPASREVGFAFPKKNSASKSAEKFYEFIFSNR